MGNTTVLRARLLRRAVRVVGLLLAAGLAVAGTCANASAAAPGDWARVPITVSSPDGSPVASVWVSSLNTRGQAGGLARTENGTVVPFVATNGTAVNYPVTDASGAPWMIAEINDITGSGTLVGCVVDTTTGLRRPAIITSSGVRVLPLVQAGGEALVDVSGCVSATNQAGQLVGRVSGYTATTDARVGAIVWWTAAGTGGAYTPAVADPWTVADLSDTGVAAALHQNYLWQGVMVTTTASGQTTTLQPAPADPNAPSSPFYSVMGSSANGAYVVGIGTGNTPYVYYPNRLPQTMPGITGIPMDINNTAGVATTTGLWRGCTMFTWARMLGKTSTGALTPVEINDNYQIAVNSDYDANGNTKAYVIQMRKPLKKITAAPACLAD